MTTALYTAIYPSVLGYLDELLTSISQQTVKEFSLVVALDGVSQSEAQLPPGTQILHFSDSTIAEVRSQSFEYLAKHFEKVVLVDADDVLEPQRVASAVDALDRGDFSACGLQLVDEEGRLMKETLKPPAAGGSDVHRRNHFGLSNTAYRSDALSVASSIPADTDLVDWYLATVATAAGFTPVFEGYVGMRYRQHESNFTRVFPPFDLEMIHRSIEMVASHYRLVKENPIVRKSDVAAKIQRASAQLEAFKRAMTDPERRRSYIAALNENSTAQWWWEWVAHPDLEDIWK